MEEWFAENWLAVSLVVAGIVVATLGGLLSLTPDPDKPSRFVPVYILSITIFLGGLGLIMWCTEIADRVQREFLNG